MARNGIDLPKPPPLAYTGKTFLLVNLLGVPALAFAYQLIARGGQAASMQPFIFVVLSLALGVGIIGYNALLSWRAKRAAGWAPTVIAMTLWTVACVLTFFLLGAFTPITLALGGLGIVR